MTSQEIMAVLSTLERDIQHGGEVEPNSCVLWEIAYQLAIQNERFARIEERGVEQILKKAGFLADPQQPKGDADSERCGCPVVRFDDDSRVELGSFTGGAHPKGAWAELELIFFDPEGNETHQRYQKLADPQQPKRDADSERGTMANLREIIAAAFQEASKTVFPSDQEWKKLLCRTIDGITISLENDGYPDGPRMVRLMTRHKAERLHQQQRSESATGPFPKIAKEGDGRWGVWFGPGPSLRSFDTENEARSFILSLADKMNDPHSQGAQPSEPVPAESTQTQEK